jgi:hypothetical protein
LLILLDLLLMLEALILQEVSYVICHEAENQNCPNHCYKIYIGNLPRVLSHAIYGVVYGEANLTQLVFLRFSLL